MNAFKTYFVHEARNDPIAIAIICPTLALAFIDISVYVYCLCNRGDRAISGFCQGWTFYFPFFAVLVVLMPIVFTQTKKHVILIASTAIILWAFATLNEFMMIIACWGDWGPM
ncbi:MULTISPECIES: hypothetical protein [Rhodopirellula]|uniref:hypothetical protein n=1 Tax=Rhodopirellula TaxID=265488 RepID=UPI001181BDF5|nr:MULTISPECIES: hypothetical protein [Rhodopirellula]